MFFKDSADFYIKDIIDITKPTITIDFRMSIILGVCLFIIISLIFYPNFLISILNCRLSPQ